MDTSLIFLDVDFASKDELFETMSGWLFEHGYVNDTYQGALARRERQFPTGLKIPGHQLAIPHTYSECFERPGLVFVRPRNPLVFQEMCSGDPVDAEMIFILLVKNKSDQMPLLSGLMSRFNDRALMDRLSSEKNPEVIAELLKSCVKGDAVCLS